MIQGPPIEAVTNAEQMKAMNNNASLASSSVLSEATTTPKDIWETAASVANKFIAAPPVDEQFEYLFSVNMIVFNGTTILPNNESSVMSGHNVAMNATAEDTADQVSMMPGSVL